MSEGPVDADMFLAARAEMIEIVKRVLALHRPERIEERRVVTCTIAMADAPHAEFHHQWPAWRQHVAPEIVDALFALMIPAGNENTSAT